MALLVLVNPSNIMANFAGIAGAELFHQPLLQAGRLPSSGARQQGTYESVEKIFLIACVCT
jgi:hypothetical protein